MIHSLASRDRAKSVLDQHANWRGVKCQGWLLATWLQSKHTCIENVNLHRESSSGVRRATPRGFWTKLLLVASGVIAAMIAAQSVAAQSVALSFQAKDSSHREALAEYRRIWSDEGARILAALERWSGSHFPVDSIRVVLVDGPSWAGTDHIGLRASYASSTKKATLTHEHAHFVIDDRIAKDSTGQPLADTHAVLFLFLYDVWAELWGEEFAREQVAVESARRGGVDYAGLWRAALLLSPAERAARLARLMPPHGGD